MVEPNANPNPNLQAFSQLVPGPFCHWSFLPWRSYARPVRSVTYHPGLVLRSYCILCRRVKRVAIQLQLSGDLVVGR